MIISVVDLRALIAENADLRVALCDTRIQLRHWKELVQAIGDRRRILGLVRKARAVPGKASW
jgi:hypothetical protein